VAHVGQELTLCLARCQGSLAFRLELFGELGAFHHRVEGPHHVTQLIAPARRDAVLKVTMPKLLGSG
jgi:hypothetical protein